MRVTKYGHACFTLEKDGKLLVVDPGAYTQDLAAPENVVGIVITHEHPDHFDVTAIGALVAHNPDAVVIAHESITRQLGDAIPHQSVDVGSTITVGPFELSFHGGTHATISESMAPLANLGVMIAKRLYYPGDSFATPGSAVEILALPVSAPWCKISEVMQFLDTVKPRLAFPTHDAILSDIGKQQVDRLLTNTSQQIGTTYQRLVEPVEI